jgi:hypothetical protein
MYLIIDVIMFSTVLCLSIVTARKQVFSLSSFSIGFIWIFNFIGLVGLRLGYQAKTFGSITFDWTSAEISKAFGIASIGMLSFLAGVSILSALRTKVVVDDPRASDARSLINYDLCHTLAIIYAIVCLVLPGHNTFTIIENFRSAGASELYDLRSEVDLSRFVTQISYVLISIPALIMLREYREKRTNIYFVSFIVVIAAVAKLVYLQKQPLLLFLIQIYFVLLGRDGLRFKNIALATVGYVSLLTFMYVVTTPNPLGNDVLVTFQATVERIFLRSAAGYLAVASYVPTQIDYSGLASLQPWAAAWNINYVDINATLFSLMTSSDKPGNIAIPAIPWGYAAFGWSGVILISFASGLFIGWADSFAMFIFGREQRLAVVLLLPIAFYLSESSIFGVLVGFGGIIIILHLALLSRRVVDKL